MLSLEARIIIFKTFAICKIVYLAFLTVIPNSLIEELQKIQKASIWHSSRPIISPKTLCNNFENGGLKHVDILSKIINLQCSSLRKLCDENFHEWKIIPSHLINKYRRYGFSSVSLKISPSNLAINNILYCGSNFVPIAVPRFHFKIFS